MWHKLLFDALIGGTLVYALIAGGAAERIASAMLVAAAVGTIMVQGPATHKNYATINLAVMAVDLALLAGLAILAARSTRFWPVWLAGLQLVEVLTHIIRAVDAKLVPTGYVFILAFWSYPMVLLVAIGTFRHQQRLRRQDSVHPEKLRTQGFLRAQGQSRPVGTKITSNH